MYLVLGLVEYLDVACMMYLVLGLVGDLDVPCIGFGWRSRCTLYWVWLNI